MNQNPQEPTANTPDESGRRDVVKNLGKFAAYAAPFTVLAFTQKAAAASGGGPAKGAAAQARRR